MPYKSLAQERYFNANKAKLSKQGVNVNEWNQASKGMKLPAKKGRKVTVKQAKKMPLNKLEKRLK